MSTKPIPTPFDAPLPGEPGAQPVQSTSKQVATPFDAPLPGEVPDPRQSATAQEMQSQGVSNYQPGRGLPFGHYGTGMTTGDITPTQAKGGALAIAGTAGAAALPAAVNAGATALLPHVLRLGTWAAENPIAAKLAIEAIKGTAYLGGGYAALKKILGSYGK